MDSQRVEIEIGLLGAIFWHREAYQLAIELGVTDDCFSNETLRAYFIWRCRQSEAGETLFKLAKLDLPPTDYLSAIIVNQCHKSEIGSIVDRLLKRVRRDRAISILDSAKRDINGDYLDETGAILSEAMDKLGRVLSTVKKSTASILGQGFNALINRTPQSGAYAGSDALHRHIKGWQRGRLYILAGRPGMGKSTAATAWPIRTARRGHGVVFFSLEMSTDEIEARCLSDLAYTPTTVIPYSDIIGGELNHWQRGRLHVASEAFGSIPFHIDEKSAITMAELRNKIVNKQREMKEAGQRLDLAIVDHLGLITPSSNYRGNKTAEVGEISAELKQVAKDYDIAVLALCQLNRAVESRDDNTPRLADLRDSGTIEQDADVVMFLYRETYYIERDAKATQDENERRELTKLVEESRNRLTLIIAKNRSGPTGTIDYFCEIACAYIADKSTRG